MTGHAFQVLLEDADILAVLATMRRHVKPDGLIVFESRNPFIAWANEWDYDMDLKLPGGSIVHESRRFIAMKNDRMTFELRYQFPDETLASASELRFQSRDEIEERLHASGLQVDQLLGDWDGKPFDESVSHEMIFLVSLA